MVIHLIAIGGSAMHNLAIALHLAGHKVSGSDDEIFEPARTRLANYGLLPKTIGWNEDNIHEGIDIVILGMHARIENPELIKAQKLGLIIQSYPEFLYEQSKDKTRIVIAGSHGKTTTTSIIIHQLKLAGIDADFMVGAKLEGFDVMVKLSVAPLIIMEGDEYLSSAIDRRPKFLHYRPHISVITGIAWDHINVFPKFDQYIDQFSAFVNSMENDTTIIYFSEDEHIKKIKTLEENRIKWLPYDTSHAQFSERYDSVIWAGETYFFRIFGKHNMENMLAAWSVCRLLGIDDHTFLINMQKFEGASKRLQILVDSESITVYTDFAHSPSKVSASTSAVKDRAPHLKLIAVLELHTFSSLNAHFITQYRNTLDKADEVIIFFDRHALDLKRLPQLDPEAVSNWIDHQNLHVFDDVNLLELYLKNYNWTLTSWLFMSSGNFGGMELKSLISEKCGTNI
jgi:UDP-N-acetylmuramate: L-alanyl-gamma-D-glutamyl-meso-diaminopimelate ligase